MGEVHVLEGDPGSGRCVVLNRYTGERTPVVVDPGSAALLAGPAIPGACPLFRRDGHGLGVCTVHDTWPAVCAEHACWRILVLAPGGRRAGRVMGSRHVAVDDPALGHLLAEHAAELAGIADAAWDRAITALLERAGYRVVR